MSKHTQGPWGVDADGICAGSDDGFMPFGGCGCCGSPWMEGETDEERLANARLIAAAPELLEALKKTVRYLPQCVCEGEPGHLCTVCGAESAIAKAEGGAA